MSAIISFATIGAADLAGKSPTGKQQLPTSREWIGLATVFFMLSAASDLGVDGAGGMAILVMVAMLLARGEDAMAYLGVRIGPTPAPKFKESAGLKAAGIPQLRPLKQIPHKPSKPANHPASNSIII